MYKVVSLQECHKILSTHWLATVPVVSRNLTNGGTGYKEGRIIRDRRKRDTEWTNWMERGKFCDGWNFFVSNNSVDNSNQLYFL